MCACQVCGRGRQPARLPSRSLPVSLPGPCLGQTAEPNPRLPHLRQAPRQRLDHHRLHALQRLPLRQQPVQVGAQGVALSLQGEEEGELPC